VKKLLLPLPAHVFLSTGCSAITAGGVEMTGLQ